MKLHNLKTFTYMPLICINLQVWGEKIAKCYCNLSGLKVE